MKLNIVSKGIKIIFICFITLLFSYNSHAQEDNMDGYVKISGKVMNALDSTAVQINILYEKLPYYDDIGLTASNHLGEYEFYLSKTNEYNLTFKKEGFEDFTETFMYPEKARTDEIKRNIIVKPLFDKTDGLFTLNNLVFDVGSVEIRTESYSYLDKFSLWLKNKSSYIIQLEGHTDIAGNSKVNLALSKARVDAVKKYLIKQGIRKSRIYTKSFGDKIPIQLERSEKAKRANRRVEVRILDT